MHIVKEWTDIDRLPIIWKSDLSDKIKWGFFQAVAKLGLLYGYTTGTLMKIMEKKLDGSNTRMLCAVLNKSWKQNITKNELYNHLLPILQTIQVRWTRHVGQMREK